MFFYGLQYCKAVGGETHWSGFKHPMTVTIFINLIPPSQAHQQSSCHILIHEQTQKHSEMYLLEKTWL